MIEVIAQTLEDAKRIEASGGHRIELVKSMDRDGLTPDMYIVESIVKTVSIPVRVMIRPHDHTFSYDQLVFHEMIESIRITNDLNVEGIVIGVLKDNDLHHEQIKRIVEVCKSKLTFHRAIDTLPDVLKSYNDIITYDFDQVLTSGGMGKAEEHLDVLSKLYKTNHQRPPIPSMKFSSFKLQH